MTTAEKIAERNRSFQGHSEELCRLQRDFNSVSLRKKKRLEHISKRRANASADSFFSISLEFPAFIVPGDVKGKYPELGEEGLSSLQRLRVLVGLLRGSQEVPDTELIACMNRLIARTKDFPFEQVFDNRMIQVMLSGLLSSNEVLITDILSCLINIFNESNEQLNNSFVSGDFISISTTFLRYSHNENVIENTLWALSNLMGDNKLATQRVYDQMVWKEILRFCSGTSFTLRSTAQWVLSNLARDKHFNEAESMEVILTSKLGLLNDSEETLKNSAWTLFYLTDSDRLVEFLFQARIELVLLPLIKYHSSQVQYPVLKVFGNISTSSNENVFRYLIEQNFINLISTLLTHPEQKIKAEVLFIFSNFLAASDQVVLFITSLPCFKVLVKLLDSDKFKIKKEALCAVCNAACCKNWEVIRIFLAQGIFPKLIESLFHNSPEVLVWVLDALLHSLQTAQGSVDLDCLQDFYRDFTQVEGFSRLNQLIHSPNQEISDKSLRVLNFL